MNRTTLGFLLVLCGCAQDPGSDAGSDVAADLPLDASRVDAPSTDIAADRPVADGPGDTQSTDAAADAPVSDVAVDAASDSGPTCAGEDTTCTAAPDNCCPGLRCVSGIAGFTCVARTDCAGGGRDCGPAGMACCPGLVCMVRGGAGGMVCASPSCRATGAPCDPEHPCCPASNCSGPPGAQRCLPSA